MRIVYSTVNSIQSENSIRWGWKFIYTQEEVVGWVVGVVVGEDWGWEMWIGGLLVEKVKRGSLVEKCVWDWVGCDV